MKNKQGGMVPSSKEEMERAKEADLLTLPEKVTGTNCLNCQFVKDVKGSNGYCNHPKVKQLVSNRNCCAYWSASGVIRPWETK